MTKPIAKIERLLNFCDTCLPHYQSLVFDAECLPKQNVIPFGTIFWSDEHPFVGGSWAPLRNHRRDSTRQGPCYFAGADIAAIRSRIWNSRELTDSQQRIWIDLQRLVPNWPGFHRIDLTQLPDDQKRMLPTKLQKLAGLISYCPYCSGELATI